MHSVLPRFRQERYQVGDVSGTQVRQQVRGRSKFGLGFALTHILIKSDNSHQKSIFDLAVADFDLAATD